MSKIENWAERGMPPRVYEVLGITESYVYVKDFHTELQGRFIEKGLSGGPETEIPIATYYRILRMHHPRGKNR